MTEQKRRFSISRTLGTIGAIAVPCCVIWLDGGELRAFSALSPFLLVVGLPFFLLLAGFRRTFLSFIPDAFKTFFTVPVNPDPMFVEIARSGGQYSIAAGLIGTVLGLIHMLANLENAESMGPAIAMAFLAMLYGVIVSECVYGFLYRAYIEQTQEGAAQTQKVFQWSKKGVLWSFCSLLILLVAFFVMIYSMGVHPAHDNKTSQISDKPESCLVELKPFETNIGDPRANHIIRLSLCLVASDMNTYQRIRNDYMPLMRDRILCTIEYMKIDQFAERNAKEQLKRNIMSEINASIKGKLPGTVIDVMFTDFVIK